FRSLRARAVHGGARARHAVRRAPGLRVGGSPAARPDPVVVAARQLLLPDHRHARAARGRGAPRAPLLRRLPVRRPAHATSLRRRTAPVVLRRARLARALAGGLPMIGRALQRTLPAAATLLAATAAHACAVCGGGNPANRFAFVASTATLTLL